MTARSRTILPAMLAACAWLLPSPAAAESRIARTDLGVAAVDTRTGVVLWEAWRPDEIPKTATKEQKTATEALLRMESTYNQLPADIPQLPIVPVKEWLARNPWPCEFPHVCVGKSLIYLCAEGGVVAFDPATKKEVWRLSTARLNSAATVVEAGNTALMRIGSDLPTTLAVAAGTLPRTTMEGLKPHTLRQQVAAALLLHHYGDGYHRPEFGKIVEPLRLEKSDLLAEPAAKLLEKRLADWPAKRDRQRLFEGCVAALLDSQDGNPLKDFPWPDKERVLIWCLLQELVYDDAHDGFSRQGYNYAYRGWDEQPVALADAVKSKLSDHCKTVLAAKPGRETPFAASVLLSTSIGWSKTTEDERKALFLSPDPSAWRWAAMALAKNGHRDQLIDWSAHRPAADHLDVIWVLKHAKPKEWSKKELDFWVACAEHAAGGVATVLNLEGVPTPETLRAPIRAYLEKEIATPAVKPDSPQASGLFAGVQLLGAWNDKADTALLLKYLKHPFSIEHTRPDGRVSREYRLRGYVGKMLVHRGAAVPPDTVYNEVVDPAK